MLAKRMGIARQGEQLTTRVAEYAEVQPPVLTSTMMTSVVAVSTGTFMKLAASLS
jgi:hypothetical protein